MKKERFNKLVEHIQNDAFTILFQILKQFKKGTHTYFLMNQPRTKWV